MKQIFLPVEPQKDSRSVFRPTPVRSMEKLHQVCFRDFQSDESESEFSIKFSRDASRVDGKMLSSLVKLP